jgi:hypothetical protein
MPLPLVPVGDGPAMLIPGLPNENGVCAPLELLVPVGDDGCDNFCSDDSAFMAIPAAIKNIASSPMLHDFAVLISKSRAAARRA